MRPPAGIGAGYAAAARQPPRLHPEVMLEPGFVADLLTAGVDSSGRGFLWILPGPAHLERCSVSDRLGRRRAVHRLVVQTSPGASRWSSVGMIVQAVALGLLLVGNGGFHLALAAAALLGVGTAMVYPTLLAALSDASQPRDRARVVGVYRFSGATSASSSAPTPPRRERQSGSSPLSPPRADWPSRQPPGRHHNPEGGAMRASDCPCGHRLRRAWRMQSVSRSRSCGEPPAGPCSPSRSCLVRRTSVPCSGVFELRARVSVELPGVGRGCDPSRRSDRHAHDLPSFDLALAGVPSPP